MTEVRFFKTNDIEDPGFLVEPEEVARQFWASARAQDWLINPGMRLQRLVLDWVAEHIGQQDKRHEDWGPIYDAIGAAMPLEGRQ